ncbi:MAG TPA: hypothetical protein PKC28_16660 [Bdellovibrionales bacterium]|nr:hypothetical protein [Bdellovibrionales bacterium]
MKYVNIAVGWLWRRKALIGIALASALLFFVWLFPFSDLSQVLTTVVAQSTGNQVYVQPETLDVHLLPQPAVSATNVSIETMLPPLEAKWVKFRPSLMSLLLNIGTIMKAQRGDAEAQKAMATRFGFSFSAEGLLGGDVDLSYGPGRKAEGGGERARARLQIEELNLDSLRDWADLAQKIQGRANVDTDIQFSPDFTDQPEGEFNVRVEKFNMPAGVAMIPMNGVSMPVNYPGLTLANAVLKGRLVGGSLVIEDGQFGQGKDPLYGRIKGQFDLKMIRTPAGVAPQFGKYAVTVDLNANHAMLKELGFVFMFLDKAKTGTTAGARYLFRAQGYVGSQADITRLTTF